MTDDRTEPRDFIRTLIDADRAAGKHGGAVVTRFPPEPNGYLHIGHAKAIVLNFSVADEFAGRCHLRLDDTNPTAEDLEYVKAIKNDVRWLGYDWGENLFFASDYYDRLYVFAEDLIGRGLAYVCDLSAEETRQYRGTLTGPGRNSPYRDRSVDENLTLFRAMRDGEFEPGAKTLRAKIDMASPIIVMRDPVIYRIQRETHYRIGDKWCVYPMYDFAHCLSDSIEGVTHSLCTLEFTDNRALYDWVLEAAEAEHRPQQIEFARLNITYTVMSKRILRRLVEEDHVNGWDDPRMPTISGLRRRGYPPAAIRAFVESVGIARSDNTVQFAQLEHFVRQELNRTAERRMVVLDPIKVTIENYPEGETELLTAINNPEDSEAGTREIPFSRELYIEREDFMEDPPKKFFRLAPGREVRLRSAYFIKCNEVVKDPASGDVVELRCTYDPATRGGDSPDGRKVKATLHWVSAAHAKPIDVRVYEPLFSVENPNAVPEGQDFTVNLNPDSLQVLEGCMAEPSVVDEPVGTCLQFERKGYFAVDSDSTSSRPIFNRTTTLRDSWAKISGKST